MFEYAISCGEGTLKDYGVIQDYDFEPMVFGHYPDGMAYAKDWVENPNVVIVFRPASPDCLTGQ